MFRKLKREKNKDIKQRVLALTENVDCNLCPPPMDAQVALNELCRHLLGEDWYVIMPVSQEQVNTEIVYAIERKYRRVR